MDLHRKERVETPWGPQNVVRTGVQTARHRALESHGANCIAAIRKARETATTEAHVNHLAKAEKHFGIMWGAGFWADDLFPELIEEANAILAGRAKIPDFTSGPKPAAPQSAEDAEWEKFYNDAEAKAKAASNMGLFEMWKSARASDKSFMEMCVYSSAAIKERSARGGGSREDILTTWKLSANPQSATPDAAAVPIERKVAAMHNTSNTATRPPSPQAGSVGGPPPEPTTTGAADRKVWAKATAEWEAEHEPEKMRGFTDKGNYIAYRTQVLLGNIKVLGGTTIQQTRSGGEWIYPKKTPATEQELATLARGYRVSTAEVEKAKADGLSKLEAQIRFSTIGQR